MIFSNPRLVEDALTPYAALARQGLPGAWAFLLAPLSAWLVWTTFRRTAHMPDRVVAVFAAAIMVSPYAMNYEACLLAPAVAAYLARTDERLWPLYATVACFYAAGLVYGFAPVAMALVLPLSSWLGRSGAGRRAPPLAGAEVPARRPAPSETELSDTRP